MKTLFDFANDKVTKKRYSRNAHGGDLNKGKRKLERPLSTKRPIHLVLHAAAAKGTWSFRHFRNAPVVESIIRRQARKFGVKVHDFANAGNHLHIKIGVGTRDAFKSFLRSITCLIARKITGARRGRKLNGKFWDTLAFSRVLKSFQEEINLRGYLIANRVQGGRNCQRDQVLKEFRRWVNETYSPSS